MKRAFRGRSQKVAGTAKTTADYENFTEQIEPVFRLMVDDGGGSKLPPEDVACDTKRGDLQQPEASGAGEES
jgi:hypothetical protein